MIVLKGAEAAAAHHAHVDLFRGAILEGAALENLRPAVVAAIISRETHGDPATSIPGTRAGLFIGDKGRGCGPMQCDVGSFPTECSAYKAGVLSNEQMILLGCRCLADKFRMLRSMLNIVEDPPELERWAVAAYNTGQENVYRSLGLKRDVDTTTFDADYSRDVLEQAAWFEAHGYAQPNNDPTSWEDT